MFCGRVEWEGYRGLRDRTVCSKGECLGLAGWGDGCRCGICYSVGVGGGCGFLILGLEGFSSCV